MSAPPKPPTECVMFADISQSTSLYLRLGDAEATELVLYALQAAGEEARGHEGRVVDSKGDDVLCTFPSPEFALQAAWALQGRCANDPRLSSQQVAFRVGINCGEFVESGGNIYGDAVNVASRLVAIAKANQILVSRAVYAGASERFGPAFRLLGELSVRGKSGMHEVYEALPRDRESEITEVVGQETPTSRSTALELEYRQRKARLNPFTVRFVLGRDPGCDLVISQTAVSREHAEIRYRNGRFVLSDFSTNGTWVQVGDHPRRVHRSMIELRGEGVIYLGILRQPQLTVRFRADG